MAYLGEFQAVSIAADADKLDGKDSTAFVQGTDIGTTVEAHNTNLQGHIAIVAGNPHGTTAVQVGADPTGTATAAIASHIAAPDPHTQYTTTAEAAAAAPVQTVAGKTGLVSLDKTDVGLSNVTNDSQVKRSEMGVADGVATLDGNGKVNSAQLPAYVDDVLEYANLAAFPVTGTSGIVYVAADTNVTYRWSGSAYVVIGSDLALGETSSTAYRGDRGKTAYDHSQTAHAPSDAEANVNADWNASSGDAQILNKPTLGLMAFDNDVVVDGKQYVRKDRAWSEVVIPEGGVVAEVKSTTFTAVKNHRYVCDTTSAAFTATLPATPAVGDYIEFLDSNGTWNPNNLTLGRNGSLINGAAEDFVCDTDNVQISLTYVSAAYGWAVKIGTSILVAAPHTTVSHSDWPADVSMTEVGYLDGVTSAIQTQLNALPKLNVQQVWTKPQRPSLSTETAPSSNTVTWDLTSDQVFRINLNANVTTFNLTGTLSALAGYQYQCVVRFNGGSTMTWNANMKFEGGTTPTLTGTSGKVDIFNFVVSSVDGTNYYLLCTGLAQNL